MAGDWIAALAAVGTRHVALVRDACRRHLRVIANFAIGAHRTILHARTVLTNLACATQLASARIDAGVFGVVVGIRHAGLSHARRGHTRVLVACTVILAPLIAALTWHCEAVVQDALASIHAVFRADFASATGHAVTRILAAGLAFAFADRRSDAGLGIRRRSSRCTQNRVVGVEHRLRRAITTVVGDAVIAERHACIARGDRFTTLARRAREFTRQTGRSAETGRTRLHALVIACAKRCRRRWILFVVRAVAIVVVAIARLFLRTLTTNACELTVHARIIALLASTRVHTAQVTNRRGRRRNGVCRAVDTIRCRTGFVDGTIAVVVDTVTDFRLRTLTTGAAIAAHAVALQDARLTRALVTRTRVKRRVIRCGARTTHNDAIVNGAVAVIVEAVAELRLRTRVANAIKNPASAIDHARDALAFITTAYGAFAREHPVVDRAVAVVVEPVASLCRRCRRVRTDVPKRAVARQRATVARRHEHTVVTARCARRRTPLQRSKRAAVARKRPTPVEHGRWRIGKRTVIDTPVAIVVHAVADFAGRLYAALTNHCAADTGRRAECARRLVDAARLTNARHAVVHDTIAIVVFAVANFRGWSDRTHTDDAVGAALRDARNTFARIRSTRLTHARCVVDHAVAVVVDAVAGFRRRTDRTLAGPRTHRANQRARRTRRRERARVVAGSAGRRTPRDDRTRCHAPRATVTRVRPTTRLSCRRCIRERRVIDRAVAVVVDAVALFRLRLGSTLTNQGPTDALQGSRRARRGRRSAGRTYAHHAFVNLTVAIVVDAVTHFRRWPDVTKAQGAAASLRALSTLAWRPVDLTSGGACWHAGRRRNAVIGNAITVVVDHVADFRLRIGHARLQTTTGYTRAHRNGNGGLARLGANAIRRSGQTTRLRGNAVISNAITIVVATVADFGRRRTRGTAHQVFIDEPVAIIVLAVTDLSGRTCERIATLRLVFVNAVLTVVVRVVADVARVVAKPVGRLRLLRRVRARKQRQVAIRRRRRNAVRVLRQTRIPLGRGCPVATLASRRATCGALRQRIPRTTRASRGNVAVVLVPLVRASVAVVVGVVACLGFGRRAQDGRKSVRQLHLVARDVRRRRAAGCGNGVRRRYVCPCKRDDVGLDLPVFPANRDAVLEQVGRNVDGRPATTLVTVRHENNVDAATGTIVGISRRRKRVRESGRAIVCRRPLRPTGSQILRHTTQDAFERRATTGENLAVVIALSVEPLK